MPASLQLALLIAVLLPAGKLAAAACTRFGIPAILGELMVGVVAGPGCFNVLHMHLFSGSPAADSLLLIAQIGGMVLMFIAGSRPTSIACARPVLPPFWWHCRA
jgi:Kef-type K+ transport system membrane component KefB